MLESWQGFQRTHNYRIDHLRDDMTDSYTFTLRGGQAYRIKGVCDEDCSDIDFRLYDEHGNLVDSDTASDDIPIVKITPAWTGEFRLDVKMYRCNANPCYFGIGVFGR